jgi:hypothetical protein
MNTTVVLKFQGQATSDGSWTKDPTYMIKEPSGEVYFLEPDGQWTHTLWKSLGIQTLVDGAYQNGFKLIADYKTMNHLSMNYGVRVGPFGASATVQLNLDSECEHDWFDYTGMVEQFTFCKKCDVKK